jgi:hypothetical protein
LQLRREPLGLRGVEQVVAEQDRPGRAALAQDLADVAGRARPREAQDDEAADLAGERQLVDGRPLLGLRLADGRGAGRPGRLPVRLLVPARPDRDAGGERDRSGRSDGRLSAPDCGAPAGRAGWTSCRDDAAWWSIGARGALSACAPGSLPPQPVLSGRKPRGRGA